MARLYEFFCPKRTNPDTGEEEWYYFDKWRNKKDMDMHGPGALLDYDWGPGDEYD